MLFNFLLYTRDGLIGLPLIRYPGVVDCGSHRACRPSYNTISATMQENVVTTADLRPI